MNIYEITNELMAIYNAIAENEGVITPELEEALAIAGDQLEAKAENYCKMIANVKNDVEGYAAEIKRLQARKSAAENLIERLKNALRDAMIATDNLKLKAGTFALGIRTTEAVNITDESAVPDDYCEYTKKISKSAIKEALKSGAAVAGAEMVSNQSLSIR